MKGLGARARLAPVIATAALLPFAASCGGTQGPVDGDRAYAHVKNIVELGPRPSGSEALRAAGDYLMAEIAKLDLVPNEQTWTESVVVYGKPRELRLRNVWTEIPGKDPEHGPILLLACHYDSKLCADHPEPAHNFRFVGAIDGAGASGVLLELARVLSASRRGGGQEAFGPNVWIAWFDGEECAEFEWETEKSLLGSRHFAETMAADKERFPEGLAARMRAMVLLDLIGDKNIKIDRDTRSSKELLDIFEAAAKAMGEGDRMFRYESPMVDDHVPFKRFGVAVVDLIDFKWRAPADWEFSAEQWARQGVTKPPEGTYAAWWHTPEDDLSQVGADSLAFAGNLVWHALPAIEQALYVP